MAIINGNRNWSSQLLYESTFSIFFEISWFRKKKYIIGCQFQITQAVRKAPIKGDSDFLLIESLAEWNISETVFIIFYLIM